MKQINNAAGFTLVELAVAIVVLAVVGTSITSLYLTIQSSQMAAYHAEIATRAGQRQIESLRNTNYNGLTPGQTINFTSQLPDTLPNDRTGTVTVSEPNPGLRRVDVNITYESGNSSRTIKLSSLIGVIGITQ